MLLSAVHQLPRYSFSPFSLKSRLFSPSDVYLPSVVGSTERQEQKFVVVIVREPGPSTDELRNDILQGIPKSSSVVVHVVPGDWQIKGAWTLLPLFPRSVRLIPLGIQQ